MPRRVGLSWPWRSAYRSVIDGTIVNVALPTIGQELGISSPTRRIVNAYQLAIMVSLLVPGAKTWSATAKFHIGGLIFHGGVGGSHSQDRPDPVPRHAGIRAAPSPRSTPLIRFIYPKVQLGCGMGINVYVVVAAHCRWPG